MSPRERDKSLLGEEMMVRPRVECPNVPNCQQGFGTQRVHKWALP